MSGRNVRRLPRCLWMRCLTPSCFPSARNTFFHINRTSQYHIIPKCEQVQGAEAQLRKQFHTDNLLIFGGAATFWKELTYLVCVQVWNWGFAYWKVIQRPHLQHLGEVLGFFSLHDYAACCIASVLICGTVLKQRLLKGVGRSVWAWLTDSEWASALFRPAGAPVMFKFRILTANNEN